MPRVTGAFDRLASRASQNAATHMTRRGFIGRSAGLVSIAVLGNEMVSMVSPTAAFAADGQACESIMCMAINGESNVCPVGSTPGGGGSWNACPTYNPAGKCVVGSSFGPLQQVINFSDCTQPNYGPGCASTSDSFCNSRQGWNHAEHQNPQDYVTCRVLTCLSTYCGPAPSNPPPCPCNGDNVPFCAQTNCCGM